MGRGDPAATRRVRPSHLAIGGPVTTLASMTTPGRLDVPIIGELLRRCEVLCVAACCGIDAFDVSPLHVTSLLVAWGGTGGLEGSTVATLERAVQSVLDVADQGDSVTLPMGRGHCVLAAEEARSLAQQIRRALVVAPGIHALAEELGATET